MSVTTLTISYKPQCETDPRNVKNGNLYKQTLSGLDLGY